MRQGGDGRGDMPFRSYAPNGNVVIAADGDRGTIVSVGAGTVTITWASTGVSVVYPSELPATIRRALPWE